MEEGIKKIVWREAATGGLLLGLAWAVLTTVESLLEGVNGLGLLQFASLIYFIYLYNRRISAYYPDGFTFGQSFGFITKMMLFAGVIVGLGQFLNLNYISPDYMQTMVAQMEEIFTASNSLTDNQVAEVMASTKRTYSDPYMMIFGGVFTMLLSGGLVGMVMAVFMQKKVMPRAEGRELEQDKTEENQSNGRE